MGKGKPGIAQRLLSSGAGFQRRGCAERSSGRGKISSFGQSEAQVQVGFKPLRAKLDCLLVSRDCICGLAQMTLRESQIEPYLRIARLTLAQRLKLSFSQIVLLFLQERLGCRKCVGSFGLRR